MPFDVKAYIALLLFVPLSLSVIVSAKNPTKAILGVMLGGFLFLPELAAFDFPLLPPMDKNGFAAVMALFGALMVQRKKLFAAKPMRGVDLFFLVIVVGNIGTAMTNGDTLVYGQDIWREGQQILSKKVLSPIRPYDIISMTVRDTVGILIPFYLGRALVRSRDDAIILLELLVIFGIIYVPLMMYEMKMSPQLHRRLYGYMANSFAHSVRGDGFKPTVFLNNGLPVAMFMLSALLSATALHKLKGKVWSIPAGILLVGFWLTLGLSRNVGVNLYALAAVPVLLMSKGKFASRLALALFVTVISYPSLRSSNIFPAYEMVEFVQGISPERAQSINTRFRNEDQLLERAIPRIWFGWGGYGRNRLYNDFGKDISITDGEWVIRMGGRGIIGFVGSFGLLLGPILIANRRNKKVPPRDRILLDTVTIVVAFNALDLLPNGMFTRMPIFLAGACAGLAQGLSAPTRGPPR